MHLYLECGTCAPIVLKIGIALCIYDVLDTDRL
jgi:hypothetical protein